jgi:triphosphoribosyl-dephospho-CoA synthase
LDIAAAAQLACLLEASAAKPGNVSPGRPFGDTRYEDFLASAVAIGPSLGAAGTVPLGTTIGRAIAATRRVTRTNTNLGIVLLLAPLARAAASSTDPSPAHGLVSLTSLRTSLRRVLAETTVDDAREVYAAIRLAAPGGLGRVDTQDVASEPTLTLLDVMRLAAHRDGIAREYATAFDTTFESGVPALEQALIDGLGWDDAVVETFLTLLALSGDTHIVRRAGPDADREATLRARHVLDAGGVRSDEGRRAIAAMDVALRDVAHASNPGTTADLTAAALFVVLVAGGWLPGREGQR